MIKGCKVIITIIVCIIIGVCFYNIYKHNIVFWREHPFFHDLVNRRF
jgi:hypothetical protein